MQSTKISPAIQRSLEQLEKKFPLALRIARAIHDQSGRTLLVGGAVRDLLLDMQVKDIDLEVHGMSSDQLESLLQQFGTVDYVGKAFGVFKFFYQEGRSIDIALPRSDTSGRKPEVRVDPSMPIKEAFQRRDLTINAMGIDLVTHELIDPFNGYQDLKNKQLRAVDPTFFIEDPLRFYRVMQFVGRFSMDPDDQLNEVCATMNVDAVSVERIEKEFEKLFLQSIHPSRGIRWLRRIGRLHELLPEIGATIGVEQEPSWHPEGDVFEHSMQALDAAALFDYENEKQKLILMYSALCHDIGKVSTTEVRNGKIISHGHAQAGARLIRPLLSRITGKKDIIDAVGKLVACHMQPLQLVALDSKPSAYKRLADRLAPQTSLAMIALLARADRLGRNPVGDTPLNQAEPEVDEFIRRSGSAQVLYKAEEPVLLGRDLIDSVEPGAYMGKLLKRAYEIQIEEGITDKGELKNRVLKKTRE